LQWIRSWAKRVYCQTTKWWRKHKWSVVLLVKQHPVITYAPSMPC
jgi:hypothetical protein